MDLLILALAATATAVSLPIPNAHRWSPADPFLYRLRVRLEDAGDL